MANRTINTPELAALGGLLDALNAAARAVPDALGSAEDAVDSFVDSLGSITDSHPGLDTLMSQAESVGTSFLGAAGKAVSAFADFDSAMSSVKATGHDAAMSIDHLRQAALDAGADTAYSAVEAAGGVEALARAGLSAADILGGGLTGSLDLATAGELDVAKAAEITASALDKFGLDGTQASHVADLLAAAASKSHSDVSDMGEALDKTSTLASRAGLTIDETTGALAAMADAELTGSAAGESFKAMLENLTPQTDEAKSMFERLGISAYDAQGQFLGLESFAGQLQTAMQDLSPEARNAALGVMFGKDAVAAANTIYQEGAAGIRGWTAAVDDQGFAAAAAGDKTDNLKGDFDSLGDSLQNLMISLGEGADGPLRTLVQAAGTVLDKLNELPDPLKHVALLLVGGGGLVALGVAGLGKLSSAISAGRDAINTLGSVTSGVASRMSSAMRMATLSLGAVGLALTVGSMIFGQWSKQSADAKARTEAFADTLDSLGGTTEDTVKQINAHLLDMGFERSISEVFSGKSDVKVTEWAKTIGLSISDLNNYIQGNAEAIEKVQGTVSAYMASAGDQNEKNRAEDMITLLDKQKESLTEAEKETLRKIDADKQMGITAEAAGQSVGALTQAQLAEQQATEAATKELEAWMETVSNADASFIDLMGGYDATIAKKTEWAENEAATSSDASDSWEDYYNGVDVSMDEYLTNLEEQVLAQQGWESNMLLLSGRVSQGVIDELTRLGPEGAPLVADLVNASDEELARLEAVYAQRSDQATGAYASSLASAGPVFAALMSVAGADAAAAAAAALASGETSLQEVISQYDLWTTIDANTSQAWTSVEAFANDVARKAIRFNLTANVPGGGKGVRWEADGGVMSFFAAGGMHENHVAQIAPASTIRVWAEPETGGEAYIPLAPSKRARSLNIWRETGRRLGQDVEHLASGGLLYAAERALAQAAAPVVHPRAVHPTVLAPAPAVATVVQVTTPAAVVESAVLSGALTVGDDGLLRLVDGRIQIAQSAQSVSVGRGY